MKDFLRELATITAGILIALALEGVVAWHHHRELVREARANILTEIHENQRELRKEQLDLSKMHQQVQALIDFVHEVESNGKRQTRQFPFIWSLAELHSTSWNTAGNTGAMSYMDYSEVKKYTEVYDLQHQFELLQQRGFASSLDVEGLILGRSTRKISDQELTDAERRLGVAMANVNAMQQFAEPLDKRYQTILDGSKE